MIVKLFFKALILFGFFVFLSHSAPVQALELKVPKFVSNFSSHVTSRLSSGFSEVKLGKSNKSSRDYNAFKNHDAYLESARHIQIPQWADQEWYVEDWTSQTDGATLIKDFYSADILRAQKVGQAELPVLVVGPNFYRLSGFDKRRIATTVDAVYGITKRPTNASFILEDWYTKKPIGVFDEQGLRLH